MAPLLGARYVVYDNNGKQIESGNFYSDAILKIGNEYHAGFYYLAVIINDERNVVRLVKF